MKREERCKKQLDHAVFKEVMWRQNAKIQWAKEGDKTDSDRKNGIKFDQRLEIDGGCFVEDENGIEKEILVFQESLF